MICIMYCPSSPPDTSIFLIRLPNGIFPRFLLRNCSRSFLFPDIVRPPKYVIVVCRYDTVFLYYERKYLPVFFSRFSFKTAKAHRRVFPRAVRFSFYFLSSSRHACASFAHIVITAGYPPEAYSFSAVFTSFNENIYFLSGVKSEIHFPFGNSQSQ